MVGDPPPERPTTPRGGVPYSPASVRRRVAEPQWLRERAGDMCPMTMCGVPAIRLRLSCYIETMESDPGHQQDAQIVQSELNLRDFLP